MRPLLLAALATIIIVAAGCKSESATPRPDPGETAPLDSRIATFKDALLDQSLTAILYRVLGHEGQVWDYPDGPDGPERPFQTIPHKTLDARARERIAALLTPANLKVVEKSDFPRYSYLLELVTADKKISRTDFHTEGGDVPVLFWMPELGLHARKEPVHMGFEKGGLERTRKTMDAVWENSN